MQTPMCAVLEFAVELKYGAPEDARHKSNSDLSFYLFIYWHEANETACVWKATSD